MKIRDNVEHEILAACLDSQMEKSLQIKIRPCDASPIYIETRKYIKEHDELNHRFKERPI